MRALLHPAARTGYLVLTLLLLLAGDAVRFTFGWWSFGVLALVSGLLSAGLLIAQRDRWRISTLPYPLLAFVSLATLSLAWSAYRPATALGLFTTWLIAIAGVAFAITFTWREFLRGLSMVLKTILALSLLFELFVSLVVRAPILPLFTQPGVDYSIYDKLPKMLYWSRNELFQVFDEGRIQGIVGNANNLGLLALLAVIVFVIELADRSVRRRWGIPWLALAAATLVFTRSATVTITIVALLIACGAVLVLRAAPTAKARAITYAGILAVVASGATIAVLFNSRILELLGKSADLTGRFGIWQSVIELAQQRPAFGWGWVSFWMPWAAPFDNLAFRNGVRQLQAHNVWIDIWFQVGIIGLILFAALALSTTARAWLCAVDPPQSDRTGPRAYNATSLFPFLVMTVLLVQSLAESRLIVEYGWAFLILIAVKTKRADARD